MRSYSPTQVSVINPHKIEPLQPVGDFFLGAFVEGYRIEGLLAEGGFSTVYVVTEPVSERRMALKLLHRDLISRAKTVTRFLREIAVMKILRHPFIADVFDYGKLPDGRPFFVMELLTGPTIAEFLRAKGRLSPEEVFSILEPVCSALQVAHDAGIVHRDIKLSNIAFTEVGGKRIVKLLDFGIAKLLEDDQSGGGGFTTIGAVVGSLRVTSPEQILSRPIDARTDIYALGVLVYTLLVGDYPFRAPTPVELATQHLDTPPPHPSALAPVSLALDRVVLRCMAKEPEHRFDSVRSFFAAFCEATGLKSAMQDSVHESPAPTVAGGIFVEFFVVAGRDEIDEELGDRIECLLDAVEQEMKREMVRVLLVTGTAILGVRPLGVGRDCTYQERRAFIEFADLLYRCIEHHPKFDQRLRAAVSAHVDEVFLRSGAGIETASGPLMCVSRWAPQAGEDGIHISSRLLGSSTSSRHEQKAS